MASQSVLVYASELAAAIGRNKYKQPWQVFENMWRRINEQQYEECVSARGAVECAQVNRAVEVALDAIAAATQHVDASSTTAVVESIAANAVASVQHVVNVQVEQLWQDQPQVAKRVKTCKTSDEVTRILQVDADAALSAAQQAADKAAQQVEAARVAADKAAAARLVATQAKEEEAQVKDVNSEALAIIATRAKQVEQEAQVAEAARVAAEEEKARVAAEAVAAALAAAQVKQQVDATVQLVQKQVELQSKAVSEVQCKFGTVREAVSREQVQRSGQARDIHHDNKFHVAWMSDALPVSARRWGVGGRLDGLDAEGRVVEIKNRAHHFFAKIPDYEYVQVQAYMHMMSADKTLLVQQLNGRQRTCIINRCTNEWNDCIVPALYKFVSLLDLFVDDESYVMRAEWVRSTDAGKQSLLDKWLQDEDEV